MIIIVSSNSLGAFDLTIGEGKRNNQKRLESAAVATVGTRHSTPAMTQQAIFAASGSGPPETSRRVSTPAAWPAEQRC